MAEANKPNALAVVAGTGSSPLEQAAIVLLSMGEEPAAAVLRCLSREELLEVTQVMSRMSGIKVEAVKTAMQRFFDDYRRSLLVYLAIFIVNAVSLELTNQRAVDLFSAIFDRLNAAIMDLDALALLPSA